MPTCLTYYFVSFINLKEGKVYEREMSSIEVDTLVFVSKINEECIQILSKKYLRTENLLRC